MRRTARPIAVLTFAPAIAVAVVAACSDDPAPNTPIADEAAAESGPIAREASPGAPPEDAEAGVDPTATWKPYTGYPGCLSLRVPPSKSELPIAPKWEACSPKSPPGCRRMVLDWTPQPGLQTPTWMSTIVERVASRGNAVTLMTNRWYPGGRTIHMIWDLDGPVQFALANDTDDCIVHEAASDGDFFAYQVDEVDALGDVSGWHGAIAGRIDELVPSFAERLPPPRDYRRYVAARPGLADSLGNLRAWNDGGTRNDLPRLLAFARGDDFFSRSEQRLMTFSTEAGAVELLRFDDGGNTHAGAAASADEQDLVWLEADRRDPLDPGPAFANVVAYTSPLTTTPENIVRRVLRTDVGGYGVGGILSRFAVGCGYAARSGYRKLEDGGEEPVLSILRLSDGAAWFVRETQTDDIFNYQPFAVTCTEVVTIVQERSEARRTNIVRLRLDALGPPAPP